MTVGNTGRQFATEGCWVPGRWCKTRTVNVQRVAVGARSCAGSVGQTVGGRQCRKERWVWAGVAPQAGAWEAGHGVEG